VVHSSRLLYPCSTAVVFAALITTIALVADPASTAAVHVIHYDLASKGMTLTHVEAVRSKVMRDGQECTELRLTTETKFDLLVFKYALKSQEILVTTPTGLVAYSLDSVEDGKRKTIFGQWRQGVFHFDVTEDGQSRTWEAAPAAFDFATDDGPAQRLEPADGAKTFRVLDPEDLAVVARTFRAVAAEPLTVGDRKVTCRVVEIEDDNMKIRRWFTTDELGLVVLREDGCEKRGTYSMRATHMETSTNDHSQVALPSRSSIQPVRNPR